MAAIRRVEARHLWSGAVVDSLARYERFVRKPGRFLESEPGMPCPGCDPLVARDDLEIALILLPPRARAELRQRLAWADSEFERKTLPDPVRRQTMAWQPPGAWWNQRLLNP